MLSEQPERTKGCFESIRFSQGSFFKRTGIILGDLDLFSKFLSFRVIKIMNMSRFNELCKSPEYLDFIIYVNHETNKVKNLKFLVNVLSM